MMTIERVLGTSVLVLPLVGGCVPEMRGESVRVSEGVTVIESDTEAMTTDTGDEAGSSGDDSSSGGGAPEDPQYPRPEPLEAEGECPAGFLGPITFDFVGWVCIPGCEGDDPPSCPSGLDGDAEGRCATNPTSSADPCSSDADCVVPGERCGNIGMGQRGCLLPPSHCILRCDDGQTCPESMTCSSDSGICQYTL